MIKKSVIYLLFFIAKWGFSQTKVTSFDFDGAYYGFSGLKEASAEFICDSNVFYLENLCVRIDSLKGNEIKVFKSENEYRYNLIDRKLYVAHLERIDCDEVIIGADSSGVEMFYSKINKIKRFEYHHNTFTYFRINRCNIGTLDFSYADILHGFYAHKSQFDTILFITCKVYESVEFNDVKLPKFICLDDVDFEKTSIIDLTGFRVLDKNCPCKIQIDDCQNWISRLQMNYEDFELVFDSSTPDWKKQKIYKQLLEEQQRQGYVAGYQKLERDFKQFEYLRNGTLLGSFKNYLDKTWWNYGYDKFEVVKNSVKIFFIFFLINIFLYSRFLQIYFPEKFKRLEGRLVDKYPKSDSFRSKIKFQINRIPIVFVYSAYLFWGVKLDIKEIEIRKPLIYSLLIIEYISGIICLAYIANYIISK